MHDVIFNLCSEDIPKLIPSLYFLTKMLLRYCEFIYVLQSSAPQNNSASNIHAGNYTFSSRRPCAVPSRRATGAEKEDLEGPEKEQGEEEVDLLMQGLTFGELCNEFECISSPAVERTARQLAKDIVELKEEKRQLSCYGVYCKYKVRNWGGWGAGVGRKGLWEGAMLEKITQFKFSFFGGVLYVGYFSRGLPVR